MFVLLVPLIVVSIATLVDVWQIASFAVHVYDESYSILCVLRLCFLSEKEHRAMRLINSLLLFLFFLLQFVVVLHASCSQPVLFFALLCFPLFFLFPRFHHFKHSFFLLSLPLYICQVRSACVRIACVFIIPTLLCTFGLYTNSHFGEYVCTPNPALYV